MGQVWSFSTDYNTVVILRVAFEGDAVLSPAHKPAFQSCRCQPPKPGTHHAHRALLVYQNARMHMTFQDLFQAGMSRARSTLSRHCGQRQPHVTSSNPQHWQTAGDAQSECHIKLAMAQLQHGADQCTSASRPNIVASQRQTSQISMSWLQL
jgi:hypothetical protein